MSKVRSIQKVECHSGGGAEDMEQDGRQKTLGSLTNHGRRHAKEGGGRDREPETPAGQSAEGRIGGKQQEQDKMLTSLKKGDNVLTIGGIYGIISNVKEKENILVLKIADNVRIEVTRNSIAQVIDKSKQ